MANLPNYSSARIIHHPYDVAVRLDQLGAPLTWLSDAVDQAATAYKFAPTNGLNGNGEYYAADRGLHVLCSNPDAAGWHRNQLRQIPVAMNRDCTVAINVTTGDENTGIITDFDPRTKTMKGPATREAQRMAPTLQSTTDVDTFDGIEFWTLLGRWDDEPLFELSRSNIVDDDGRISGWIERVIIGTIGGSPAKRRAPVAPPTVALPVVRRRAA